MRFKTVAQKAAAAAVQFTGERDWKQVRDFVGSSNFHSYDPVRQLILIGPEGKDRVAPSDWVVRETQRATGVTTFYVVRDADFQHEFDIVGERDIEAEEIAERERVTQAEKEGARLDAIDHRSELPSNTAPEPPTDLVVDTAVPPAGSSDRPAGASPGMKEVLSRETSQPRFAPVGRPGMGESAAPNSTTISSRPGPSPATPIPSPGPKAVGFPVASPTEAAPVVVTSNVPGSGAPKK